MALPLRRIVGGAAVVVVLLLIGYFGQRVFREEGRAPAGTAVAGDESEGIEYRTVTLFFGARDSATLVAERRDVLARPDAAGNMSRALEDLARGPLTDLEPTLPAGTRVRHVFLDESGTVYVDFSREIQTGSGGGLSRELLTVSSLARTIAANFPGTTRLQLLVEGAVVPTLSGHLDVSRPLTLADWD